jgi:uncharacterized PurR-regulated membrane protein YhhQ (DUF165 family)
MVLTQKRGMLLAAAAMVAAVALSNVLVQYPLNVTIGRLNLADLLTWGAFSYPISFLVTDLTNRTFGVAAARRVVYVGFAIGILLSIALASPRLAIASGTAFLLGQLLDVSVFDVLRNRAWWKAPVISSIIGSAVDTLVFFTLAFAPVFVLLGANDEFALGSAPLLGLFPADAPRWISWALGDYFVKLLIAAFALVPYRVLINIILPLRPRTATT